MSLEIITKYETSLWQNGIEYIAGIDEVGRGALAGPMVVSAVIINKEHLSDLENIAAHHHLYHEIKDSKLLSAKKREVLSEFITNESISYSYYAINHKKIDEMGIMPCTQIAFSNVIKKLNIKPQHVFTDNYEIKDLARQSQTNLIRGDNKSITVAAASIIAKVYRDQMMVDYHYKDEKYSVYQFHKHKGYGTKLHREMIKKHGYSDIHRRSYHVK